MRKDGSGLIMGIMFFSLALLYCIGDVVVLNKATRVPAVIEGEIIRKSSQMFGLIQKVDIMYPLDNEYHIKKVYLLFYTKDFRLEEHVSLHVLRFPSAIVIEGSLYYQVLADYLMIFLAMVLIISGIVKYRVKP